MATEAKNLINLPVKTKAEINAITDPAAQKAAKATNAHNNFNNDVRNWGLLSSNGTITGEFVGIMNQLGKLSLNLNKILGTVENSIKVLGL